MKFINKSLLTVFALSILAIPLSVTASAAAATTNSAPNPNVTACSINFDGTTNDQGRITSKFKDSGNGTVTAILVVKGGTTCKQTISIASWRAPYGIDGYLPLVKQTLVHTSIVTYGVGSHTIVVPVADCRYQVDVSHGQSPTAHGTAVYGSALFGWVKAGKGVCKAPVAPVTPSVTPVAPTITPIVTTIVIPKVLPSTGAGNMIALFGIAAVVASFAHNALIRRKLTTKRT